MLLKSNTIVVGFLLFFVFLGAILLFSPEQKLDKQTLHKQLEDLQSYTRETILVASLYKDDKTTSQYTKFHLEQLQKKILSFYDVLEESTVTDNQKNDIRTINTEVTEVSLSIAKLRNLTKDKKAIDKEVTALKNAKQALEIISKKYE